MFLSVHIYLDAPLVESLGFGWQEVSVSAKGRMIDGEFEVQSIRTEPSGQALWWAVNESEVVNDLLQAEAVEVYQTI